MKYERAVMEILLWEDEVLPITQVSESVDGQFGDLDADGLNFIQMEQNSMCVRDGRTGNCGCKNVVHEIYVNRQCREL